MGLIAKLFGNNPARVLEKVEAELAKGQPGRALELLADLGQDLTAGHREHAKELGQRARAARLEQALARATQAEESGYLEDAAEWLALAIEDAPDEATRKSLAEQRENLGDAVKEILREERRQARAERLAREAAVPQADDLPTTTGDALYETLIMALRDDVLERYEERPEPFRHALLALNEGAFDVAMPVFEELASGAPDDPVLQLERGRCRLRTGDAAGALEDFEAAWKVFGDEPIDLALQVSLPGLWAEAALASGEPKKVVQRLARLAEPRNATPEVAELFADALVGTDELEPARKYLARAVDRFHPRPELSWRYARVLDALGQPQAAIDTLEEAIAPACATGNCNRPAAHAGCFRLLIELYLEIAKDPHHRDEALERAGEVLAHMGVDQDGQLEPEDVELVERYHSLAG